MFQAAQGPEGLIWTDEERAALQAFLSYYESEEGDNVAILEAVSGPLYPKLSTCFEGARLTQLVQLVTADRLFPCHEGRVDP